MADTEENWKPDGTNSEQEAIADDVRYLQLVASTIALSIADDETNITKGTAEAVKDPNGWIDARMFPNIELLIKCIHATAVLTLRTYVSADRTNEVLFETAEVLTAATMNRTTKSILSRYVRFTLQTDADGATAVMWLTARNRTL